MSLARLFLVFFLWALCFPLIEVGRVDVSPLRFATMRAILAGAVLLGTAVILRKQWPRTRRVWLKIACIGIGATSLGFWGMFEAGRWVAPGLATVLANTQPLIAAVLAVVFLRERLSPRLLTGLLAGFAGIALIAFTNAHPEDTADPAFGLPFLMIAILGISGSNVLIKQISREIDPLVMMGLQLLIGAVPLGLAALVMEADRPFEFTASFGLALFFLALPGTALAYWLWTGVLRTMDLSRANAFSFLVPVIGLFIGWTYFGERFTAMTFLGIIIVLGGLTLANWPERETNHDRSQ